MSSVSELLDQANELLTRGSRCSNRIACWVARIALEETVGLLLNAKNRDFGQSSMASRLTCLEIAYADQPQWQRRPSMPGPAFPRPAISTPFSSTRRLRSVVI